MILAKKIVSNTFSQFAGRVITALLAIISVKLISYYLGVDGYGMYATVYEFVGLFAIAGDLGLYTISLREMADSEGSEQKIYSNVITIRAVLTALVMVLVAVIAFFIPAYQGTVIPIGIMICAVSVWFNLFNSILTSILQYHLKMELSVIGLVIGKIVAVLTIAGTVYLISDLQLGFYLVIGAGILGHAIMTIMSAYFARRFVKISFDFDFVYWKNLLIKSLPYGLALIFSTIYFKIDVVLISLLLGKTDVGLYAMPLRIIEVLAVLPLFFMNSVMATLTKAIKQGKAASERIFNLSMQFLLIIAVPIFVFFYYFSKDVILLIASEDFLVSATKYASDDVLIFLAIGLVISFFSTLGSFSLVAYKQQNKVLLINLLGAIFNISTNLYFIPKFGFIAAAFTTIASEVLILILSMIFVLRTSKFKIELKNILITLLLGLICFYVLDFLLPFIDDIASLLRILISATICFAIYIPSLIYFRVIPRELIK